MAVKIKKFVCSMPGKYEQVFNTSLYYLDLERCNLVKFAITLYDYKFVYICLGFIALIIIISIFGKIKENYKWFILNQALWDLFITLNYLCGNPIFSVIDPTCNYPCNKCPWAKIGQWLGLPEYNVLLQDLLLTQPYTSLFLLSLNRFMCLYFMNFYKRFTQRKRSTFYFIIAFNIIFMFLHINSYFDFWWNSRRDFLTAECLKNPKLYLNPKKDSCYFTEFMKKDFWYNFIGILFRIFNILVFLKPILCLLFAIIATIMIVTKIGNQAKFQIKHNRKDFLNSVRISAVMLLQTLLLCLVFSVELFKLKRNLAILNIIITFGDNSEDLCSPESLLCIKLYLPKWFAGDGTFELTDYRISQSIVQCRIFLESIIILIFLTGYREAIRKVFYDPWKNYVTSKSGFSTSKVSTITTNIPSTNRK